MENTYKTKDLGEAGVLIVKKQNLLKMERKNSICWFVFKDKSKCQELSNNFFFGDLMVNAREYTETINRLKNRIFSNS